MLAIIHTGGTTRPGDTDIDVSDTSPTRTIVSNKRDLVHSTIGGSTLGSERDMVVLVDHRVR